MELFENLISYFCEYDLYSAMFSHSIKDGKAKDVLLEQLDFNFVSSHMLDRKVDKIWGSIKNRLEHHNSDGDKEWIRSYVNNSISLDDLSQKLSFKRFETLDKLKGQVNQIQKDPYFYLYYPVVLNRKELMQQPLFTFSCRLLQDSFQINKVYVNKDILTLMIAQQKKIEMVDAKSLYEKQIDEGVSAVDALHQSENFYELYEIVCGEFKRIFDEEITQLQNTQEWQMLEKAIISFESPDKMIDHCFRDEIDTLRRYHLQDHILPDTVQRYLGVASNRAVDVKKVGCTTSHLGSYQAQYPVNKKQWQLVQLAKQTKLLCVEGPPGTGKTTLLKEMIADILVEKANALLAVWEDDWKDLGEEGKGIICSPLQGKNLNSIVMTSTNNKAIDNIGLELLKEVPYFSHFAKTIEDEKQKYGGILCARLGKGDNIKAFYRTFFKPFCEYLSDQSMDADCGEEVKAQYVRFHDELEQMNQKIAKVLSLREQLEPFADLKEFHGKQKLGEKQGQLENEMKTLTERESLFKSCISEQEEIQANLKECYQCAEQDLAQYKKDLESKETQLHKLYSDLKEYENIGLVKKVFSFMLPKVKELLQKYGSAEQIRDLIQDSKTQKEDYKTQIKKTHDFLSEATDKQSESIKEEALLRLRLDENNKEYKEKFMQKDLLSAYSECMISLSHQVNVSVDDLLNRDVYQLSNGDYMIELRNKLFIAAVHLIEAYICIHKMPILHNLGMILKEQSHGSNSSYKWCQALYNGDRPYPEKRAGLVRALWETFFLCFPVITTTLHSFRKSTFQMIPDLFDVLMVDESGQIVPYYVLAPLYRARRTVFVGDENQIEPIKSVPPGLLEKKYAELLGGKGYSRFCMDFASVQTYAVAASDYYEKVQDQIGGVILNEHRRCEPAIMAFSNQYIYRNVLDLKGDDNYDKLFGSNLVAFDIRGFKAAQHYNQAEIEACTEIIGLFIKQYGEEIKKEIGVITPFARQAEKLREAIPGVEIGTVHVFQGAEKKYILFSSVIDDTSGVGGLSWFIGGKGNLLNVAFSRAKKQFIYVGNLQAAKEAKNYLKNAVETISKNGKVFSLFGINSEVLLADTDVIRILTGVQSVNTKDKIGQYLQGKIPHNIIDTPLMHNEILNHLLLMSMHSVYVVSPWIGSNVVTENMLDTMKRKLQNGISIHIVFGYKAKECSLEDINDLAEKDIPWGKEEAANAIQALKNLLGNKLRYSPPSHVKLLLVDDKYLFIGSLNWLYNSGKTEQKEISCLITDLNTIKYVKEKFL